jgi:hypothetical protein
VHVDGMIMLVALHGTAQKWRAGNGRPLPEIS